MQGVVDWTRTLFEVGLLGDSVDNQTYVNQMFRKHKCKQVFWLRFHNNVGKNL